MNKPLDKYKFQNSFYFPSNICQNFTLHRPNSITKAMDGLFKYNRNRAWFARALS